MAGEEYDDAFADETEDGEHACIYCGADTQPGEDYCSAQCEIDAELDSDEREG